MFWNKKKPKKVLGFVPDGLITLSLTSSLLEDKNGLIDLNLWKSKQLFIEITSKEKNEILSLSEFFSTEYYDKKTKTKRNEIGCIFGKDGWVRRFILKETQNHAKKEQ